MSLPFRAIALFGFLALLCGLAPAQQAAPSVTLPMERTQYFVGENIPLAVGNVTAPYLLTLTDAAGRVAMTAKAGTNTVWRLDTAKLAPGEYAVCIDGQSSGVTLGLASPLRKSCAALTDESGNLTMPTKPADRENIRAAIRESGITALLPPAQYGHFPMLDEMAPTGTLLFMNPTNRVFSFYPCRVYGPEMNGYHLRLSLYAQANSRYPNFAGYWYDWDAAGTLGMGSGLIQYYGFGKEEQNFRNYSEKRDQALRDQFKQRTGLIAPSQNDFLRYCLATGQPDFAPSVDFVAYRWTEEIAKTMPPLSKAEVADLEKRLDAWSKYLMGIFEEKYTAHQAVLREVNPSLRNSASVNIDHGPVRLGHWHPSAYKPLDFRYCTAWADGDNPGYRYQWLITAGILDSGRPPEQPVWIGSFLGTTFARATYPGNFMLQAAQNLAYGGRGLGFAFEGFSTLLSSMNKDSRWENIKGHAGEQDLVAGREFLTRFAPLGAACLPLHKVGLLYSQSQMARQHTNQGGHTILGRGFFTLARLGYAPKIITEDDILHDGLAGYQALVVMNQSVPLSETVLAKLNTFTAAGGKLVVDKASTVKFAHAVTMDVNMPYKPLGAPHNWIVPNEPGITSSAIPEDQHHAAIAPAVYAALGNTGRTALMPAKGADTKMSTFTLDGGPDATYVIATDDANNNTTTSWARFSETLTPNGAVTGTLYDLTKEQALGPVKPVECAFEDLTAHVYGILARPVA